LFAPADDPKKAAKALASGADVVVLDLEDAVLPDQKEAARQSLAGLLAERPSTNPRVFVRVNAPGTKAFLQDLQMLKALNPDGIMVPKAERPESLEPLWTIGRNVVLLIETALGLDRAPELARALSGLLERLAFGYLDFVADIGACWTLTGEALLYARSRIVLASRIGSLEPPLDGVYPTLDDAGGLKEECRAAKVLGFGGKMIIHPKHISAVQEAFAPTQEELDRARGILGAFEAATKSGQGVLVYQGRFVDRPVVLWAERVLRLSGES
jgi:citrate lyase subunit beta/citryl-CoA lyase